jgi:hypothetical protein
MNLSAPLTGRPPARFYLSRRRFLQTASASLALSTLGANALDLLEGKPRRVGLIGAGWYGKSDLFRLIQVAPVEVVSICDPDQHMLAAAARLVSQRWKSKKKPRTFTDYRRMLQEKDLDLVLIGTPDHWHALQMIAAGEKRSRPIADIEEGHISSASCVLANVSMQLGRPLVYHPKKREVVGDAEATRRLRRPYRAPWPHGSVSEYAPRSP